MIPIPSYGRPTLLYIYTYILSWLFLHTSRLSLPSFCTCLSCVTILAHILYHCCWRRDYYKPTYLFTPLEGKLVEDYLACYTIQALCDARMIGVSC